MKKFFTIMGLATAGFILAKKFTQKYNIEIKITKKQEVISEAEEENLEEEVEVTIEEETSEPTTDESSEEAEISE